MPSPEVSMESPGKNELLMRLAKLEADLVLLRKQLASQQELYDALLHSKSWKITAPLRKALLVVTKLRTMFGRAFTLFNDGKPVRLQGYGQTSTLGVDVDTTFYRRAYADVTGDPVKHYVEIGRAEGRLSNPPKLADDSLQDRLDPGRENVLIVTHDASRSGVPVLTASIARCLVDRYNVLILPLLGGELLDSFAATGAFVLSPFQDAYDTDIASATLLPFLARIRVKFAIANSIVSRSVLPALAERCIPCLCLVHEFTSYVEPKSALLDAQLWATRVVFSARLVYENAVRYCPELADIEPTILPQGCTFLERNGGEKDFSQNQDLLKLRQDQFIVLGVGTVEMRKGVDLFLSCAEIICRMRPEASVCFCWAGKGYEPERDFSYSVFLKEQIERAGLEGKVIFLGHCRDMSTVYERADVLLLSSRLDPLPNVAIEAMDAGLPVVCFNNTTGIADILKEDKLLEDTCVAPYLDVYAAARLVVNQYGDKELHEKVRIKCKDIARQKFNMQSYAESLEAIALGGQQNLLAEKADYDFLLEKDVLLPEYAVLPSQRKNNSEEITRQFVRSWRSGVYRRKPFPGFHPGIFAEENGLNLEQQNPLVEYIKAGCPDGPWSTPLVTAECNCVSEQEPGTFAGKIALHIHCYYTALMSQLLQPVVASGLNVDLLVSVTDIDAKEVVTELLKDYRQGHVDIRVVPNRGRDLGPLLSIFNREILDSYEIIGHVHTKKSVGVGNELIVQLWFDFLVENLLGGKSSALMAIINAFRQDDALGMIFPDDPYVVGWGGNKELARTVSERLNLKCKNNIEKDFINFPVGTMFWARTVALRKLFEASLSLDEYPCEPVLDDGTILHAMERLLPFIVTDAGFSIKCIHVPGTAR